MATAAAAAASEEEFRRARRAGRWLFAALLSAGIAVYPPVDYDNSSSRLFLLSAVVDYGQLSIEPFAALTMDTSSAGGHVYTNKAIGAPLLAVPVYFVARHFSEAVLPHAAPEYVVRLITTTVPFALVGLIAPPLLVLLGASARAAVWATLAFAFGTIAWLHALQFSGHGLAAALLLFSFAIVAFSRRGPSHWSARPAGAFAAGLLAGLGALADYVAVVPAVVIALYACARLGSRFARAAFVAGALVCAAVLAAYNLACFGSPLALSYASLDVPAFRAGAAQGVLGVSTPRLGVLLSLVGSPARGLFFVSPILLAAIAGLVRMYRSPARRESIVCAAAIAGVLALNAGFYGWHGGFSYGPRYMVAALPFFLPPLAFAVDRSGVFLALFWLSALQITPAALGMQYAPPEVRAPLTEIVIPLIASGYLASGPACRGNVLAIAALLATLAVMAVLAARAIAAAGPTALPPAPRWAAFVAAGVGAGVLVSLLVVTTSPRTLHEQRARLLQTAADATGSPRLARAALLERLALSAVIEHVAATPTP